MPDPSLPHLCPFIGITGRTRHRKSLFGRYILQMEVETYEGSYRYIDVSERYLFHLKRKLKKNDDKLRRKQS